MEQADERCRAQAVELRRQLATAQKSFVSTQQEHSKLREVLDEALAQLKSSKALQAENAQSEQEVLRLQTQVEGLTAGCGLVAEHLATMQAEVADYQNRIGQLCNEQTRAGKEALVAVSGRTLAEAELENVRQTMHQSFQETSELQHKFSEVDDKFEKVMGAVERESFEAVQNLQEEIRACRRSSEKNRRRSQELQARLAQRQAEAREQMTSLKAKETEIRALQECCEAERRGAWRREEQFMELQQKSFLDQSQELQKMTCMMPVETHERIVREQSDYYKQALQDMEDALEHQLRRREEASRRLRDSKAATEKEQQAQQQEAMLAALMAEQEALKSEIEVKERRDREELELCRLLKEDVKAARPLLASSERAASTAEERCVSLSRELEVSTSRLGLLKDMLLGERKAKESLLKRIGEEQAKCMEFSVAPEADDSGEDAEELRRTCAALEAKLSSQHFRMAELEMLLTELTDQDQVQLDAIAEGSAQRSEAEKLLQMAKERVNVLKKQIVSDAAVSRQRRDVAFRLQSLLEDHSDESRSSLAKLRWQLREEQRSLAARTEAELARWVAAVEVDECRQQARVKELHDSRDAALEACRILQSRLDLFSLEPSPEAARVASDMPARRAAAEEQRAQSQVAASNAGRVLAALGTSLPAGLPETARRLLADGTFSPVSAEAGVQEVPSAVISLLEAELREAVSAGREAKVEEERLRSAAEAAKSIAESEASAAVQLMQCSERRSAACAKLAELSKNLEDLVTEVGEADAASSALVLKKEEELLVLGRRLTAVEVESRLSAEKTSSANAALAAHAAAAAVAAEQAAVEAKRPLEEAIMEASGAIAALRQRLPSEVAALGVKCKQSIRAKEQHIEAEVAEVEAALRQEIHELQATRSICLTAADASHHDDDSKCTSIEQQIDKLAAEVASSKQDLQQLQELRAAKDRAAEVHRDVMWDTERKITDLTEARSRDLRHGEDEMRELARQHASAAGELKQELKAEMMKIQKRTASVAKNLTAELAGEVDELLAAQMDMESKSARLLARARGQLGAEGGA
eukprot:TRINITY_DN34080_c0_g1_i1.p1 TRINITY_DN34080_c0_g1~~TRINITY_DN34080_c0_g1_i1.p1  ORF type:complete len:1183 (+),score=352.42 TRINITY_DN34080_c0_g1_i1:407-3550(+)